MFLEKVQSLLDFKNSSENTPEKFLYMQESSGVKIIDKSENPSAENKTGGMSSQ